LFNEIRSFEIVRNVLNLNVLTPSSFSRKKITFRLRIRAVVIIIYLCTRAIYCQHDLELLFFFFLIIRFIQSVAFVRRRRRRRRRYYFLRARVNALRNFKTVYVYSVYVLYASRNPLTLHSQTSEDRRFDKNAKYMCVCVCFICSRGELSPEKLNDLDNV